jgi:putative DNA primase/helicase
MTALDLQAVTTDLEPLRLTDVGNARRFVLDHGRDLRYVPAWGWLMWDGRRWTRDDTLGVMRRARHTVAGLYAEAAYADDDTDRKALAKHAMRSESEARLKAMVSLAASESEIVATPDQFDRDPWLLNVENGTVDLKSGELRPHRREDLITKLAPVRLDPDATCPLWEATLNRVLAGDEALKGFVQRFFGYSLTGDTSEQIIAVFHGSGANGKTTICATAQDLLGDYAATTPADTLLVKHGDSIPNDLARLAAVRYVIAVESDDGRRLAEGRVKQLTGQDRVAARFLHREWFEFRPTFKVVLVTNHRPTIRGTDHAMWRRVRLVPFEVTIPDDEQDKHLGEKLRAEAPGILKWFVDGCLAWQREDLGRPDAVQQATARYRAEMDVLGQFFVDRCLADATATVTSKALYEAYTSWCRDTGERPLSRKTLGLRLAERGFRAGKMNGERVWLGLELSSTGMRSSSASPGPDAAPYLQGDEDDGPGF